MWSAKSELGLGSGTTTPNNRTKNLPIVECWYESGGELNRYLLTETGALERVLL